MRTTEFMSRALFLAISSLCLQLASASPPDPNDLGKQVVTTGGIVKFKSELTADDVVIGTVLPSTSTNSATLTVGNAFVGFCPSGMLGFGTLMEGGFFGSMGSYTPAALGDGISVAALSDVAALGECPVRNASFSASGFSANPGSSWLSSVECSPPSLGSTTLTGASATSFQYANGLATWEWSGAVFGLYISFHGTNVPCSIVHN